MGVLTETKLVSHWRVNREKSPKKSCKGVKATFVPLNHIKLAQTGNYCREASCIFSQKWDLDNVPLLSELGLNH